MPRLRPALLALAALGGGAVLAQSGPRLLLSIGYQGGSVDDRRFALAALGLKEGDPWPEQGLELALASVRATDRFRTVEARVEDLAGGRRLILILDPWPDLEAWTWKGDPPPPLLRKKLLSEIQRNARPGALRLQEWQQRIQQRLRDEGFAQAKVSLGRSLDGRRLEIGVALGEASTLRVLEWDGDPAPYTREQIQAIAGITPGSSVWTAALRREATTRLRKRFLGDHRLEWQADLAWKEAGVVRIRIRPGPVVRIAFEGDRVRWTGVDQLLPIRWADRYTPDLLDEGDRRILRELLGQGFKDAQVSHRREVLESQDGQASVVKVTYSVKKGPKARIRAVRFEKNSEVATETLVRQARLPKPAFGISSPLATPELIDAIEDRVKATYLRRGYPEVSLRRRLEGTGGQNDLVITVREGPRRFIESITLRIPESRRADPWRFGGALLASLGDEPQRVSGPDAPRRVYRSQRSEIRGAEGILELLPSPAGSTGTLIRLAFPRPIPMVKADLARALGELRQLAAGLGTPRPLVPRLSREEGTQGEQVAIEIQDQPLYTIQRTVVQGSDETRAAALLRDPALHRGTPLDPAELNRAQARIGNLGAFSRVDFLSMAEAPIPEPHPEWKDGDLLLRLQERPHWVLSSGFGYDRLSGYHVLFGVQRLNFQGMGRTLEFNARAGDATLRNPGLRNIFSTGPFRRSLDMYTLGYSDPLFDPGFLEAWLPERTEYRATGAYLDEIQSSFEVRRRRVLNSLQWKPADRIEMHIGHRFERVEVTSIVGDIPDDQLNQITKTPGRVIISAPYLQYTQDRRDNPFDPTEGTYFFGRIEMANQLFGSSKNASFVKLDLRHQWNWPVGARAEWGVVSASVRLGVAQPTQGKIPDSKDPSREIIAELPLSERFFSGGPGSHRGVEPDTLGPIESAPVLDPATGKQKTVNGFLQYQLIPVGGQGLVLMSLEYRFPLFSRSIWGEVFVDSGQVYQSIRLRAARRDPQSPDYSQWEVHQPLLTALGAGLIFKLGIPVKLEYAADLRRLRGKPRDFYDRNAQLRNILISAGFTF